MLISKLDEFIAFIKSVLGSEYRSIASGSNTLPFFEKPNYLVLVEPRLPDYTKPYVLDTYAKEPSSANLESPYFRKFSRMEVLGYTDPYKFEMSVPYSDSNNRLKHVEYDPIFVDQKSINEFCALDKPWGQYKQSRAIKKALKLTTKLNSHADNYFQVPEFDSGTKILIAVAIDLTQQAGVPFSPDPTRAISVNNLDRGFELAAEIMESAKHVPASAVQAPPCHYGVYEYTWIEAHGICLYSLAMRILESRFSLVLIKDGYEKEANDPFPSTDVYGFGKSVEDYARSAEFSWIVKLDLPNDVIHPDLIDYALNTIRKWFVMSPEDSKVWNFLKYYLRNTPVLLPSGQMVRKKGGIARGSEFEHIVLSVISVFVGVYGMLNQGLRPEEIERKIHHKDRQLVMSVPHTFSQKKFVQDSADLGFRVWKIRTVDNLKSKETINIYPRERGPFEG